MLIKIKLYLENKKQAKRIQLLKELPSNSHHKLLIAHNKELCAVEPFIELLKLFKYFPIEGPYLQQNINTNIISFKSNIYDTCITLSKIRENMSNQRLDQVFIVARIARLQSSSYLFFNDKPDASLNTFDQKSLDQLVSWMLDIVMYFESNKTNQEKFEEAFCSVTFRNLDIYFDFFYSLICHVANIPCDHLLHIAQNIAEDL